MSRAKRRLYKAIFGGGKSEDSLLTGGALSIKVQGGTPHHSTPSLCVNCKRSSWAKGEKLKEEIVWCHAFERRITFKVTQCSDWDDKNHASIYEMESIAWVLRTDGKASKIGFVQPKDLSDEEKHRYR